jgi:hypothetical protein
MALFGDKPVEAIKASVAGGEGDPEPPKPDDKKTSCVVINIFCGDCCKDKPKE